MVDKDTPNHLFSGLSIEAGPGVLEEATSNIYLDPPQVFPGDKSGAQKPPVRLLKPPVGRSW